MEWIANCTNRRPWVRRGRARRTKTILGSVGSTQLGPVSDGVGQFGELLRIMLLMVWLVLLAVLLVAGQFARPKRWRRNCRQIVASVDR